MSALLCIRCGTRTSSDGHGCADCEAANDLTSHLVAGPLYSYAAPTT